MYKFRLFQSQNLAIWKTISKKLGYIWFEKCQKKSRENPPRTCNNIKAFHLCQKFFRIKSGYRWGDNKYLAGGLWCVYRSRSIVPFILMALVWKQISSTI